jgi:hypothetical protein
MRNPIKYVIAGAIAGAIYLLMIPIEEIAAIQIQIFFQNVYNYYKAADLPDWYAIQIVIWVVHMLCFYTIKLSPVLIAGQASAYYLSRKETPHPKLISFTAFALLTVVTLPLSIFVINELSYMNYGLTLWQVVCAVSFIPLFLLATYINIKITSKQPLKIVTGIAVAMPALIPIYYSLIELLKIKL